MEPELNQIIKDQQTKIDQIYTSVEKTRKYLFWTMIATVAFFVLPLVAIMFIVPSFISTYTTTLSDLGL